MHMHEVLDWRNVLLNFIKQGYETSEINKMK